MTEIPHSAHWPENFCGRVKLFPLPNLVMFPSVIQPLHIFEPRYCEMLVDSLDGDQLIAMALLESGWEKSYHSTPVINPTVCIGRVISHAPTSDGRHNILLAGMKRARILRELPKEKLYRSAEVEIIEDFYPTENGELRIELAARLQQMFTQLIPTTLASQEKFQKLLQYPLPLGLLTDTISFSLNLPLTVKQQLLAEANVDIRCRILTRCIEQKLTPHDPASGKQKEEEFPPPFSEN